MAELVLSHATLEQSLLPFSTNRNLTLVVRKEIIYSGREYVQKIYQDAKSLRLVIRAQRLVQESLKKWCWKNITSQSESLPLFSPTLHSDVYSTKIEQEDSLLVEIDFMKTNGDTSIPFAFNALCQDDVINIFRIVIDVAYEQTIIHSLPEHPIFAMSTNMQQTSSNVHAVNDLIMNICRDMDPFFQFWWSDLSRAIQQKPRAIQTLEALPTATPVAITVDQAQSDKMQEGGPDIELQRIAKQLSTLPDPNGRLKVPSIEKPKHRHSMPAITLDTTNITMESLYDMIGNLTPSPATPVSFGERIEKPTKSRRKKKVPPPIQTKDVLIRAKSPGGKTPKQLTPFLIAAMGSDEPTNYPVSPIPIRPVVNMNKKTEL